MTWDEFRDNAEVVVYLSVVLLALLLIFGSPF
jgi:hypothetical protein